MVTNPITDSKPAQKEPISVPPIEKPPAKKRRPFPLFLLIAAIVAAIAYGGYIMFAPRPNPNLILASGTIEADETIISPKVQGRLADLMVDEGDNVTKGELIAKLDDSELVAQLGQAKANLAAAQAKLDEAIAGNRPQQVEQAKAEFDASQLTAKGQQLETAIAATNLAKVTDLQAQVDADVAKVNASQASYEQALQALRLINAGTRPDQIEEGQHALEQARVNEEDSANDAGRATVLYNQGAIARQSYDHAIDAAGAAQKARLQAESHLADLQAGARPEERREAEDQVRVTRANLEGERISLKDARTQLGDRLSAKNQFVSTSSGARAAHAQAAAANAAFALMQAGSRKEDIEAARAARDQAKEAVNYAQLLVGDTRLYAPTNGVVQTKSSLPGQTLSPGTPVVTVADLDHIWIRVYVPEDKYGRISVGQEASIEIDSFPGRTFKGRVAAISSDFEFTPKNSQTYEERVKLVYGVKIYVENPNRDLKPGMPGDATIAVRQSQ